MASDKLTGDRLLLLIDGRGYEVCQACYLEKDCDRVIPSFTIMQRDPPLWLCDDCQLAIKEAVYHPEVGEFLAQAVDGAMKAAAREAVRMVSAAEAEREKKRQTGWEEGVADLIGLVTRLAGQDGARVAAVCLAKAAARITGLSLMQAKDLVDRSYARAERPLELPLDAGKAPPNGQAQKAGA